MGVVTGDRERGEERVRRWKDRRERELVRLWGGRPLFWVLILGLSGWFLWSGVSGENGLTALLRLREKVLRVEASNRDLLEENRALAKEIDLLENSPEYVERIAREEYGYLREGEEVYVVSESEPRGPSTPP